jgi:hypothetical protein
VRRPLPPPGSLVSLLLLPHADFRVVAPPGIFSELVMQVAERNGLLILKGIVSRDGGRGKALEW